MTECDHCSSDAPVTVTLNHVQFNKTPVSKMVGSYTVCMDCRNKLADDPDVSWA